jgi:hypothetical protein
MKYIFITGGVVSSLGKGLTAGSLGALLECRNLKVCMQKFDPYLNIDPGTMNPSQHGEVYVLDDGTETDLDLGHYERFTSSTLSKKIPLLPAKFTPWFFKRNATAITLARRSRLFLMSPMKSRSVFMQPAKMRMS